MLTQSCCGEKEVQSIRRGAELPASDTGLTGAPGPSGPLREAWALPRVQWLLIAFWFALSVQFSVRMLKATSGIIKAWTYQDRLSNTFNHLANISKGRYIWPWSAKTKVHRAPAHRGARLPGPTGAALSWDQRPGGRHHGNPVSTRMPPTSLSTRHSHQETRYLWKS